MKRLIILFLLFTFSVSADEPGALFEKANELYRDGEYAKAAELYENIEANGYESPALYFNLGNSYFKLKNIPASILNYERARRLAPQDDDIEYNLRLANLRIVDKVEPLPTLFFVDWWEWVVSRFSADGWGKTMAIAFWVVALAMSSLYILRSDLGRRLLLIGAVLTLTFGFLSLIASIRQHRSENSRNHAILFEPSVSIKSAPDEQSVDLFVLHEGVKVEILDAVGEWRKIRMPDGKVGWMPLSAMRII